MRFAIYCLISSLVIALQVAIAIYQAGEFVEPILWSSSIGIAICQLTVLACWVVWTNAPLIEKFRWSYRLLLVQWLSFALPWSLGSKEWPIPWCLLADQGMVWIAALAAAGLIRLIIRRNIKLDLQSVGNQNARFGILDLLIFTSASAIFLVVVIKFREPIAPVFMAGLIYNIMLIGGLWFGLPTGFLLSIYVAGFATNSKTFFLYWVCCWLISVTAGLATLCVLNSDRWNGGWNDVILIGTPITVAFLSLTIIAFLFRRNGYRWSINRGRVFD